MGKMFAFEILIFFEIINKILSTYPINKYFYPLIIIKNINFATKLKDKLKHVNNSTIHTLPQM